MVQVHLMELFAREEILAGPAGQVSLFLGGPFAAPVFMTVMGYFLAASRKNAMQRVWRGIRLIFIGLGLNIGLNLHLLIKIFNGTYDLDPFKYIFGADILFLAGFSVILTSLLAPVFHKRVIPWVSVATGIAVITPFLPDLPPSMKYLQAFLHGFYDWSYFPLFPWLAYPLSGYAFYNLVWGHPHTWNIVQKNINLIMAFCGLILILLLPSAWRAVTDLPAYYHHHIILFAWMAAFLVIFTRLAAWMEEYAGQRRFMQYVKWLGKNVTAVYVFQWLIIGNIATAIYKTQPLVALPAWFMAILAAVSGLVYIYGKVIRK